MAKIGRKRMLEIAKANIDKHLGDCGADPDTDFEEFLDNVYVLAFDALADAGAKHNEAMHVALSFVAKYRRGEHGTT